MGVSQEGKEACVQQQSCAWDAASQCVPSVPRWGGSSSEACLHRVLVLLTLVSTKSWECVGSIRECWLSRLLPASFFFKRRVYCFIIPNSDVYPVNFSYSFGNSFPSLVYKHPGSQMNVQGAGGYQCKVEVLWDFQVSIGGCLHRLPLSELELWVSGHRHWGRLCLSEPAQGHCAG